VGWERIAATVTGRRSWLLALGIVLLGIGFMVLIGDNPSAGTAPPSMPADSDSAKVDALARSFKGGDQVPLIVVVNRADGAMLDPTDPPTLTAPTRRATGCGSSPSRPDPAAPPHR
jgi:RND superfamily putative drug exporter